MCDLSEDILVIQDDLQDEKRTPQTEIQNMQDWENMKIPSLKVLNLASVHFVSKNTLAKVL